MSRVEKQGRNEQVGLKYTVKPIPNLLHQLVFLKVRRSPATVKAGQTLLGGPVPIQECFSQPETSKQPMCCCTIRWLSQSRVRIHKPRSHPGMPSSDLSSNACNGNVVTFVEQPTPQDEALHVLAFDLFCWGSLDSHARQVQLGSCSWS